MGSMKALVAAAVALTSVWTLEAQTTDPVALAAKVQQRYNGIKDIQGDFVQTYEGGVLRTKTTERGTVAIKRPGRMRFVYIKPEKKEFVSDGTRLYTYLVADKQVIVSPAPGPAGRHPGDVPGRPVGSRARLHAVLHTVARRCNRPRHAQAGAQEDEPDYESIGIGVDPKTLQIQFLTAVDTQGGRSSFSFSNLKENRGLSDKQFEFRIPRGVDVVTNGGRVQ